MQNQQVDIGSKIIFTGFSQESVAPDNGDLLVKGQEYTVRSVNKPEEEDEEASYNIFIENPKFNSRKRESKNNLKELRIDLYADEMQLIAKKEQKVADAPTVSLENVKKGDIVTVTDEVGDFSGKVFKSTKIMLGLDDGSEQVIFKKKDISAIEFVPQDAEEAEVALVEEEEKKTVAKIQTKTKPKAKKETKKETKKEIKAKPIIAEKQKVIDMEEDSNMLVLTEAEEDPDILDLVNNADNILELATDLAEDSAHIDYRLGGVLYHVNREKAYKTLSDNYSGAQGFQTYVEAELRVGYRKAMYLIDIYAKWNKYGLDKEKVAEIGWTKAQEIARVMDEDNADILVELAENNSVSELKEAIRELSDKSGEEGREVVKKVTFKFRLVEDAGGAINNYIELAGQQLELKRVEDIFEHIITEWAQEHLDISKLKQ